MSDYYPKEAERQGVPRPVYNMGLYYIRDYPRKKQELDDMIQQSGDHDGQPKSKDPGDPTGDTVARREKLAAEVRFMEEALATIPEYYRPVIFDSITKGRPLHAFIEYGNADRSTWLRWKVRLIKYVVIKKGWL